MPGKPVRYILNNGQEVAEHLPRRFPIWFTNYIYKWIRYKDSKYRDFYYHEIRLTMNDPVIRKFSDLWFLDHLERDHDKANPILWYENLLAAWLKMLYKTDIAWFEGIIVNELTAEQYERVYAYGKRYYPTAFNAKMRLVYHGCSISDYMEALDAQEAMNKKEIEILEAEHRKEVQRHKRQRAKKKTKHKSV